MREMIKRLTWFIIPPVCAAGIVFVVVQYYLLGDEMALENGMYSDVYVFWGAAKLGLSGSWQSVFDTELLHQWHPLPDRVKATIYSGWLYPPAIHVLIAPLGFIGLADAWLIFVVLSLIIYVIGARLLAGKSSIAFVLAVVAPTTWAAVSIGNNSLLTAGLVAAALGALAARRAILSGVLIGAICIKPQIGLLFPFALATGGYWSSFVTAAVSALAITGITTLVVGTDYWWALGERLEWAGSVDGPGSEFYVQLVSYYGFARSLGWMHSVSMDLQIMATIALALVTVFVWWRRGPLQIKSAILLLSIPLASPHSFRYELTFVTLAVLAVASVESRTFWSSKSGWATQGLITTLYLCPLLPFFASNGILTVFGSAIPLCAVFVPVFTAAILWLMWQQTRMVGSVE